MLISHGPFQRTNNSSSSSNRTQSYLFVPVSAKTVGAINKDEMDFLSDVRRRITQSTDDHRESAFLFQRLSMLIQRYNAVAVLGTFTHTTPRTKCSRSSTCSSF